VFPSLLFLYSRVRLCLDIVYVLYSLRINGRRSDVAEAKFDGGGSSSKAQLSVAILACNSCNECNSFVHLIPIDWRQVPVCVDRFSSIASKDFSMAVVNAPSE